MPQQRRRNIFNPSVENSTQYNVPQVPVEQGVVQPTPMLTDHGNGGVGDILSGLLGMVGRGAGAGKISGGYVDPKTGQYIPAAQASPNADAWLNGGRGNEAVVGMNDRHAQQMYAQTQALERQAATVKAQQDTMVLAQQLGILDKNGLPSGSAAAKAAIEPNGLFAQQLAAATSAAKAVADWRATTAGGASAVGATKAADQITTADNMGASAVSATPGAVTAALMPSGLGTLRGSGTTSSVKDIGSYFADGVQHPSVSRTENVMGQGTASIPADQSIVNTVMGTGNVGVNAMPTGLDGPSIVDRLIGPSVSASQGLPQTVVNPTPAVQQPQVQVVPNPLGYDAAQLQLDPLANIKNKLAGLLNAGSALQPSAMPESMPFGY